jgi:hypothetical protein
MRLLGLKHMTPEPPRASLRDRISIVALTINCFGTRAVPMTERLRKQLELQVSDLQHILVDTHHWRTVEFNCVRSMIPGSR